MAEIGLIASVLQIASCGLKLSITLYTFAETVSAADKNIKHIARDVSLTSAVLNELGTSLENDKQRMVTSDNAIKTAEEVIHECSQVFTEIETTLQKGLKKASSGKPGLGKLGLERLKWPFLQPKMELLRGNLERLKSTLILMLNVLAYAHKVNQATSNTAERDFDRHQIESLIVANRKAVEEFEKMKRAIKDGEMPKHSSRDSEDQVCNSISKSPPPLGSFNVLPDQGNPVRQPTPDTIEVQAMSGLHPRALLTLMRKLGYIVDRLEDARSTITATKLVSRQLNPNDLDEPRTSSAVILGNIHVDRSKAVASAAAQETNKAKKNNVLGNVEQAKALGQREATQKIIPASAKRREPRLIESRVTNYVQVGSESEASKDEIPPDAQWTKIERRLIDPRVLQESCENFEELPNHIIVHRVLTREEIDKYVSRSQELENNIQSASSLSNNIWSAPRRLRSSLESKTANPFTGTSYSEVPTQELRRLREEGQSSRRSYGPENPFSENLDQGDDKRPHRTDIKPSDIREGEEYGEDAQKSVVEPCLYFFQDEDSLRLNSYYAPEIKADQNQNPTKLEREVVELLKAWTKIRY